MQKEVRHRTPGRGQLNPSGPRSTHSSRHMSQPDARLNQWFKMNHSGSVLI
jgi:hypothetical protein